MSVIKQEIKQCLLGVDKGADGKTIARFSFPERFVGFKGHFPGNPILPGICQIQALIVFAEELHKEKASLKKVVLAKFFKSVSQNEELLFNYSEKAGQDDKVRVKASVNKANGEKIARLELEVNFL